MGYVDVTNGLIGMDGGGTPGHSTRVSGNGLVAYVE